MTEYQNMPQKEKDDLLCHNLSKALFPWIRYHYDIMLEECFAEVSDNAESSDDYHTKAKFDPRIPTPKQIWYYRNRTNIKSITISKAVSKIDLGKIEKGTPSKKGVEVIFHDDDEANEIENLMCEEDDDKELERLTIKHNACTVKSFIPQKQFKNIIGLLTANLFCGNHKHYEI